MIFCHLSLPAARGGRVSGIIFFFAVSYNKSVHLVIESSTGSRIIIKLPISVVCKSCKNKARSTLEDSKALRRGGQPSTGAAQVTGCNTAWSPKALTRVSRSDRPVLHIIALRSKLIDSGAWSDGNDRRWSTANSYTQLIDFLDMKHKSTSEIQLCFFLKVRPPFQCIPSYDKLFTMRSSQSLAIESYLPPWLLGCSIVSKGI